MADLVIHVPHASLHVPDDVREQFLIGRAELEEEALISADLYTDLLAREAWPNARIVSAGVSRVVVDVERYPGDAQEEMAEVGRGCIYTHDHAGCRIRRDLAQEERDDLVSRFYEPHWRRLREAAASAILVDLHTYPAEPWPIERRSGGARPEIDIGFSEGLAPAAWIDDLTAHFTSAGYGVDHNTPYAGVIDAGARAAIMIEIRRDVLGQPGAGAVWTRLVEALRAMPLPGRIR